jgi:hypothetical protein
MGHEALPAVLVNLSGWSRLRGAVDRFSKCVSPCPAAEQPHWLRQPLAR